MQKISIGNAEARIPQLSLNGMANLVRARNRWLSLAPSCSRTILLALVSLLGCNSTVMQSNPDASDTNYFPAAPYETVTSQEGMLNVSTWTSPNQPPIRGVIAVKLSVTNAANGDTQDGLTLSVNPVMPVMGHGSSTVPQVSAIGDGVFVITDMYLFMAGRWNLDITFAGSVTDNATIPLDVQ